MDCGIPFCHEGCPLGNLIPEWNDLVYRGDWPRPPSGCTPPTTSPSSPAGCARRRARAPACSASTPTPVTIERIEYEIAERPGAKGGSRPVGQRSRTGKRSAVVGLGAGGSGRRPAAGPGRPRVVVYERAEQPGGLLRYGIPEFKMEKAVLDRRLAQMRAEGREFPLRRRRGRRPATAAEQRSEAWSRGRPPGHGGAARRDVVPAAALLRGVRRRGAGRRRDTAHATSSPGRDLARRPLRHGLPEAANLVREGAARGAADHGGGQARGDHRRRRHGRGLPGHRHRQGAASVHQLEILPRRRPRRGRRQPVADVAGDLADLVGP